MDNLPTGTVTLLRNSTYIALAAALAVAVIIGCGVATAPVPDVVGDTGSAAEQTLRSGGFEVEVVTSGGTSEEDVGRVIGQDPASNSEQEEGSTVTITVGKQMMIEVPDLAGTTLDEAERRVGEDFRIEDGGTEVSGEPEGAVISQDPSASSRAAQGSDVSVVTSAGQPPNPGDIFADDFSDPSSGAWPEGEDEDGGVYEYANGGYRMYNAPSSEFLSAASPYDAGSVGDAIVEVDTTSLGDVPEVGTSWGVSCRKRDDNGDGIYDADYRMIIYDYGYSAIVKYADGEATTLAEDDFIDAIRTATETNHIRADCVGSELALYVNGQKLLEAQDAQLAAGEAGLLVNYIAEEGPGADRLFDNFQVSTPP